MSGARCRIWSIWACDRPGARRPCRVGLLNPWLSGLISARRSRSRARRAGLSICGSPPVTGGRRLRRWPRGWNGRSRLSAPTPPSAPGRVIGVHRVVGAHPMLGIRSIVGADRFLDVHRVVEEPRWTGVDQRGMARRQRNGPGRNRQGLTPRSLRSGRGRRPSRPGRGPGGGWRGVPFRGRVGVRSAAPGTALAPAPPDRSPRHPPGETPQVRWLMGHAWIKR